MLVSAVQHELAANKHTPSLFRLPPASPPTLSAVTEAEQRSRHAAGSHELSGLHVFVRDVKAALSVHTLLPLLCPLVLSLAVSFCNPTNMRVRVGGWARAGERRS